MLPIEVLSGIAGAVIPQAFALVRSIFGRKNAEPEKVLGDLATNKPEVLPEYIKALSGYWQAQAQWFNRDMVAGATYPAWLLSLRGALRPALVVLSVAALVIEGLGGLTFDPQTRAFWTFNIGNWIGSRSTVGA